MSVQAAAWRRRVRSKGLSSRVTLSKGDGQLKEMVQRTYAKSAKNMTMRDVPLLLFSADKFKDQVAAAMRRTDPGPTFMHFPNWLKSWFFDELRAEVRDEKGKWKKIRARNEALDLWVMITALAYSLGPADTRRPFDWGKPPLWAAPLGQNSEMITAGERRGMQETLEEKPRVSKASHNRKRFFTL